MEWLWILLLAPLVTGVAAWQAKTRYCAWIQLGGATVMLISGLAVVCRVMTGTPITGFDQTIYVDVLGAFNIGLVVFVGFTACLYSLGHMKHELTEGSISPRQFHHYYFLLHLFLFAMLASSVVNNIGLMWVGIELTTIVSALLVGLYNKETALEAAWKYLIMGSVGLSFALLGIIFIYLSGSYVFGDNPLALHWTVLLKMAKWLNPQWMLTGFAFVLIVRCTAKYCFVWDSAHLYHCQCGVAGPGRPVFNLFRDFFDCGIGAVFVGTTGFETDAGIFQCGAYRDYLAVNRHRWSIG